MGTAQVPCIVKSVESALVGEGQDLYQSVAQLPIEWSEIAFRLKSRFLYKECLVHLTGRYNELSTKVDDQFGARFDIDRLRPETRAVIDRKGQELREVCQVVDQKIVSKLSRAN